MPNSVPAWLKPQLEDQINELVQSKNFTLAVVVFALFLIGIPLLILRAIGKKIGGLVSRRKGAKTDKALAPPDGEARLPASEISPAASQLQALQEGAQSVKLSPEEAIKEYESSLSEEEMRQHKRTEEALERLKKPKITSQRGEVLTRHLSEMTLKNPEGMAQLIRTWLSTET